MAAHPLEVLSLADPDLLCELDGICPGIETLPAEFLETLARDCLWGLAQAPTFGRTIGRGYACLALGQAVDLVPAYHQAVRRAGAWGVTQGRAAAAHWAAVLLLRHPALNRRFEVVLDTLQRQGAHTLEAPLAVLPLLCRRPEEALAYLKLVETTFQVQLPYERCLHWIHRLPKAVRSFPAGRRAFLCARTESLMARDPALAAGFLEGLAKGTLMLADEDLAGFVAQGLARIADSPLGARQFLALESSQGREAFAGRQTAVALDQVRPALSRYLKARLGHPVPVNALDTLPPAAALRRPGSGWACSDGQSLYLPAQLGVFADARRNRELYKLLAKLEAGLLEWGTFEFDYPTAVRHLGWQTDSDCPPPASRRRCDLERFLEHFQDPRLALDLFTVFEHGRIRHRQFDRYPGLEGQVRVLLQDPEAPVGLLPPPTLLGGLYGRVVFPGLLAPRGRLPAGLPALIAEFQGLLDDLPEVEAVAPFVDRAYGILKSLAPDLLYGPSADPAPAAAVAALGRGIVPEIYTRTQGVLEAELRRIQALFRSHGRDVPTKMLRVRLKATRGALGPEDLRGLWSAARPWQCRPERPDGVHGGPAPDWIALCGSAGTGSPHKDGAACALFSYPEWDCRLEDYLHDHVRVREHGGVPGAEDFYERVLERRRGLILALRRAFELLRPQGLGLLRQWPEGDDFDYRALLDLALDRRAGRTPSERLYIKRVKALRDVAVLVLVDVSRSTAQAAETGRATVLEVEQEALVLLSEALQVVGDQFALAAFSGTGPLGVDYWRLKDFESPCDRAVQRRIAGLRPQRSTRMGAAIRHAARCLSRAEAQVRLLMIIGDGFPNDLEYKQTYAIADTRRAIAEARGRHIHTHAVTVNSSGDPQLDDLYGETHHNTISEVAELPGQLLRIYGALTR